MTNIASFKVQIMEKEEAERERKRENAGCRFVLLYIT